MDKPERLERLLGFAKGYLSHGFLVARLTQVPRPDQFDLGGYTQVSTDRFEEQYGEQDEALKKGVIKKFQRIGPRNLVKVFAKNREKTTYPPGLGIPQWVIKRDKKVDMVVFAVHDGKALKRSN